MNNKSGQNTKAYGTALLLIAGAAIDAGFAPVSTAQTRLSGSIRTERSISAQGYFVSTFRTGTPIRRAYCGPIVTFNRFPYFWSGGFYYPFQGAYRHYYLESSSSYDGFDQRSSKYEKEMQNLRKENANLRDEFADFRRAFEEHLTNERRVIAPEKVSVPTQHDRQTASSLDSLKENYRRMEQKFEEHFRKEKSEIRTEITNVLRETITPELQDASRYKILNEQEMEAIIEREVLNSFIGKNVWKRPKIIFRNGKVSDIDFVIKDGYFGLNADDSESLEKIRKLIPDGFPYYEFVVGVHTEETLVRAVREAIARERGNTMHMDRELKLNY